MKHFCHSLEEKTATPKTPSFLFFNSKFSYLKQVNPLDYIMATKVYKRSYLWVILDH